MKLFRLLTAFASVLWIGSFSSLAAQEITDFALRQAGPFTPFPVASNTLPDAAEKMEQPIDELGQVLPFNQCKQQYLPNPADRCGFSAGTDAHPVTPQVVAQEKNEIDLSPLRFECMESGCEYEYAKSADRYRKEQLTNPLDEAVELEQKPTLTREEVRQIIDSVFTKELAIEEIVESSFDEYQFRPYQDPTKALIIEPTVECQRKFASLAEYRAWLGFWSNAIANHELINQPADFAKDLALELECQLCGSPWLAFYYSVQETISDANVQLEHEKEVVEAEKNVEMLQGLASLFKAAGESLIDVSDSLTAISGKRVESIARKRTNLETH